MDGVVLLDAEIKKAMLNKEVVVAVFLDIEKAYDMLWKEGLVSVTGLRPDKCRRSHIQGTNRPERDSIQCFIKVVQEGTMRTAGGPGGATSRGHQTQDTCRAHGSITALRVYKGVQ